MSQFLNRSILHSGRGQRFDNGWMWFAGFASFLLLFLFLRFPRSVEPPNFRAAQRFRKLVNLGNGLQSLSLCSVCCLLTKRNQINYLASLFLGYVLYPQFFFFLDEIKLWLKLFILFLFKVLYSVHCIIFIIFFLKLKLYYLSCTMSLVDSFHCV